MTRPHLCIRIVSNRCARSNRARPGSPSIRGDVEWDPIVLKFQRSRFIFILPALLTPAFSLPAAARQPTASQPTTTSHEPASQPARQNKADKFGRFLLAIENLRAPSAVTVDARDQILIADSGRDRIVVYDSKGTELRQFGARGSKPGELISPRGICVSADGAIFVSDTFNHRICIFDPDGKFRRSFGKYGSAPGDLIQPMGLAIDRDHLYVADAGNDRIQVFDLQGHATGVIGSWGAANGEFHRPIASALDASGNLHVIDRDNNRVQTFDVHRNFIRSWGQWGPFPGMIAAPEGMCCFKGELYLADTMNHRIQVMRPDGAMSYQWGIHAFMPREGDGKLHYPNAIAVAPSGKFAVVCEGFENRCQVFGVMPAGEAPPTSPYISNDPAAQSHFGASAGVSGNLIAATEQEIDQVSIHNLADGAAVRISMVGQHGVRPGQFVRPAGLDLNARDSTLIVGDAGNRRLHTFNLKQDEPGQLRYLPNMATLTRTLDFASLRETSEQLRNRPAIEPTFLRRNSMGELYVLDAVQNVVVVIDSSDKLLRVWSHQDDSTGWRRLTDLAIDEKSSAVFICDAGRGVVESFDPNGRPLATWKTGAMQSPGGVAIGGGGDIFVTDEFSASVFKFDNKGKLLKTWGSEGLGAGQLYRPLGIMPIDAHRLMVIDYGNHRCELFSNEGEYLNIFGATYFIRPALMKTRNEKDNQ